MKIIPVILLILLFTGCTVIWPEDYPSYKLEYNTYTQEYRIMRKKTMGVNNLFDFDPPYYREVGKMWYNKEEIYCRTKDKKEAEKYLNTLLTRENNIRKENTSWRKVK